jgi:hypothetical protein
MVWIRRNTQKYEMYHHSHAVLSCLHRVPASSRFVVLTLIALKAQYTTFLAGKIYWNEASDKNTTPRSIRQARRIINKSICLWLYSPFVGPWSLFQFLNHIHSSRTTWMGDHPVARPLPTHTTTQTQNKRWDTSHALIGIRTHDPSFRAREDSSCLRPRSHCDWH